MVKLARFAVVLGAVMSLFMLACGGNGVDLQGEVGENNSAMVTAAEGGTVALPSNSAQIVIPAGALATDTEITLNTLDVAGMAEESRLGSYVFDFGPDGTTFAQKVEISLKSGGVPSGKKAVLAWLDGEEWVEVPASKLDGDYIVGEVDHFTKFVVYLKDNEVIIDTDDPLCKDLDFAACGGDVTGEWGLETYCMDSRHEALGDNPWESVPQCQDGNATYTADIAWDGYIKLNGDGTYESLVNTDITVEMVVKDACLTALGGGVMGGSEMCTQISQGMIEDNPEATVNYAGGKCTMTMPQESNEGELQTGTWSTSGNKLMTDSNTEGQEYCVDGSYLYMKIVNGDDTNDDGVDDIFYEDIMVLKRK